MEVAFHANIVDSSTAAAADALYPVFTALQPLLRGDYGGPMDHLWIDLELLEMSARPDGSPRHPFRFQKRVSGRSYFGMPAPADKINVGHMSVRPDFALIVKLSGDKVVSYALSLIHDSLPVLGQKKSIRGFDIELFCATFRRACKSLGHPLEVQAPRLP